MDKSSCLQLSLWFIQVDPTFPPFGSGKSEKRHRSIRMIAPTISSELLNEPRSAVRIEATSAIAKSKWIV